ncbi:MAG: transporter [Symbiobacteriaceae bacterium]|jgi:MFS family permease|nr:transporter [Symbiobacteriaceae bacterium]
MMRGVEVDFALFGAARVYLIRQALGSLAGSIMFTTYALYYVQGLGLTPLQLVLVDTALEVACLLFEVPTGVVADSYGRRLSVITGTFVMAGAYLLEGAIPFWGGAVTFFWALVLAEVVRGIGWTFISGAEEAWVTDEVGADQVGELHLQVGQWERLMGLVGIPISVVLANVALHLPFLAGGVIYVGMGIFGLMRMGETTFVPRPRESASAFAGMRETLVEGIGAVRGRPLLMALLAATVIAGAASEGFDRLWEAHYLITFGLADLLPVTPATGFGILAVVSALLAIGVAAWARRYLDLTAEHRVRRTLLIAAGLRVGALVLFAAAPSIWMAVCGGLVYYLVGAIYHPAYRSWVNQQIDSGTRATVLSVVGQADALGQAAGGPVVGWVGTRFSLRAALMLAAVFLAPLVGLYAKRVEKKADI